MQSLRDGDGQGPLGQLYLARFVLDNGTVEYEGKAVESFRVQDSGFWRSMVECCHTESYYCPDCKVVVTPVGKNQRK